jgi:hypothetical protein
MRSVLAALLLINTSGAVSVTAAPAPPQVEKYLLEGKIADGEKALAEAVAANPTDGQARFGLGVIQFVGGVERLAQSFHRFGLRANVLGNAMPFARLPIPVKAAPEPIGYADLRAFLQRWTDDLARAEATLAQVDDDAVKLPLHFGQIHLDMTGDGKFDPDERLYRLFAKLTGGGRVPANADADAGKDFLITFDRGDVAWLRGYCHLLMAMSEVYLAHDGQDLFDHTAPLFYAKAKTPFPFLSRRPVRGEPQLDMNDYLDAIALVHLVRLPVKEPARMKAALSHLEAMLALSRESWKFIVAEADDDHEWVPNPKQHSVLPNATVSEEMVKGWSDFIGEAESILKGEKLIPFWRPVPEQGINLKRVFTEPRTLDLVLWVQGTRAAPYLEKGPCTTAETWNRFQRIFRGEFIGFVIWFN